MRIVIKELFRCVVIATFRFTVALANFIIYWLVRIAIEIKRKALFLSTLGAGVPGGNAFVFLKVWGCVHSIIDNE